MKEIFDVLVDCIGILCMITMIAILLTGLIIFIKFIIELIKCDKIDSE